MKSKFIFICLSMVLALFMLKPAYAQLDSCWQLVCEHEPENGIYNPDSIMVNECISSSTITHVYTKRWFEVTLNVKGFDIPEQSRDSIVYVIIEDVDSIYSDLINDLTDLENNFGSFFLRKKFPDITDTTTIAGMTYLVSFENLVNIDSVMDYMDNISSFQIVHFCNSAIEVLGIPKPEDHGLWLGELNESNDIFYRFRNENYHYHKLSTQWYIYKMKMPMAWEITMGDPNIIIAIYEPWYERVPEGDIEVIKYISESDLPYPGHGLINSTGDMYYYKPVGVECNYANNGDENGNILLPIDDEEYISNNIYRVAIGDGKVSITKPEQDEDAGAEKVYRGHGFSVGSIAVARDNGRGIIGIAPKCKIVALDNIEDINYLDLDGLENDYYKRPHVINMSTLQIKVIKSSIIRDAMEKGLIPISCYALGGETRSSIRYLGVDDVLKDLKVIGIGRSDDCEPCSCSTNCINWDPTINLNNKRDAQYEPRQATHSGYYYSPDCEEFSVEKNIPLDKFYKESNSNSIRLKEIGYDVLVPTINTTAASMGVNDLYTFHDWAPSYTVPKLSGIAALMRSVDEDLRIMNMETGELPDQTPKGLIHARAYNIITFTADKINTENTEDKDITHNEYSRQNICSEKETYYGNNFNKPGQGIYKCVRCGKIQELINNEAPLKQCDEYLCYGTDFYKVIQSGNEPGIGNYECTGKVKAPGNPDCNFRIHLKNGEELPICPICTTEWFTDVTCEYTDPLDRYYSPTHYYGRVNAFRCLLYSIPAKGQYLWTNNKSLIDADIHTHPVDGKQYLHLGSKIREGSWVDDPNFFPPADYPDGDPYKDPDLNGEDSDGNGTDDDDILNILEYGGRHFPGNTTEPWKNNHGETIMMNENGITITVPNIYVLAVDGILRQPIYDCDDPKLTQAAADNKIQTTGTGKILITGYLADIELYGRIKMDDLEIHSTTEDGYGKVSTTTSDCEIYGKVELFDKSKIIVQDGTLTIRPGGSINLHDDSEVRIKYNATLKLEYASSLLAEGDGDHKIIVESGGVLQIADEARSITMSCQIVVESGGQIKFGENSMVNGVDNGAEIVLEQGAIFDHNTISSRLTDGEIIGYGVTIVLDEDATLTLDNSPFDPETDKPIALIGGIEIKKDGQMIVKEGSNLHIGEFIVSYDATLNIEEDSDITLFSPGNDVNGTLIIGSNDVGAEKTFVQGFHGNNPYKCDEDVQFVFAKISVIDYSTEYSSFISVKNTEFENVSIFVLNAKKDVFENCTFKTNSYYIKQFSQEYPDEFESPFFFLIVVNFNFWGPLVADFTDPEVNSLNVLNCTFEDENTEIMAYNDLLDEENEPNLFNHYHLHGPIAIYMNNVSITGDNNDETKEFRNLKNGIWTETCNTVAIGENAFSECWNGTNDNNSSCLLCQNDFNKVKVGSNLTTSKKWKTYDNEYEETLKCFQLSGMDEQSFRGNLFSNYGFGIYNVNSIANLAEEPPTLPYIPAQIALGTNEFSVIEPEIFFNEGTNPFIEAEDIGGDNYKYTNDAYSDNYLFTDESWVKLYCGKNIMSRWSNAHYHVYSEEDRTSETIDGDINEYRNDDSYEVRAYNIGVDATDIDEGETSGGCNDIYFSSWQTCFLYNPDCPDFSTTVNVNFPEYASIDSISDRLYYEAIYDMCDSSLSEKCRKIRAFNAMQAATLGDSSDWKLNQLLNFYPCLIGDTTLTDGLRASTKLLLGEAYERLGELDSAVSEYQDILSDFHNTVDTMFAQWRIQFIDAFRSDTTYGKVFDSSMAAYMNRVIRDLMYCPGDGGPYGKRGAFGDLSDEELEELINNQEEEEISLKLDQNSPNPFTNLTEIQYFLSKQAKANLKLLDMNGRIIAELIGRYVKGGWHHIIVNGSGLTNGAYLLMLESEGKAVSKIIHKAR